MKWIPDALLVLGAASVAAGAWMLLPAAGLIVGGLAAMALGILAAKR